MLRQMKRSALRAGALIIVGVMFEACTLTVDVSGPSAMLKDSGDAQTAPINTALPTPLAVLVVNQFGQVIPNVTVNWTVTSGGGSVSQTPTTTNEGGVATTNYTTGATPGTATINAQVHGLSPVTFTVTVT